ncbi:hypothetical protein Fmac_008290 [Flemingia macrophylla]|uniref:Uncharacterized protein n=1 Tax=Flemingia macrophylla TaxID=520843 RepID=A0ABD1MWY4_9FABA
MLLRYHNTSSSQFRVRRILQLRLLVGLLAKTGKENRAFIVEAGAIPYLRNLLSSPNVVAQENSVTALLNLFIFDKNKSRIMDENGCLGSIVDVLRFGYTTVAALVGALGNKGVAEEAVGALALIVRHPIGAKAIVNKEAAVAGLFFSYDSVTLSITFFTFYSSVSLFLSLTFKNNLSLFTFHFCLSIVRSNA